MIYDKRGDAIRGMVFFLVRLFYLEGKVGSFADAVSGNGLVLQKKSPTFNGSFLAVASSPEYVKFMPRELISAAERHRAELDKRSSEIRGKSGDYSVKLIEARYSPMQSTNELFGEPLALPSLMVRKEGSELSSRHSTGRVHLGMTLDGKKAEEGLRSLLLTAVFGKQTDRALRVLLEGCLLNGVSGVVFRGFDKVDSPNPDTGDYSKYGVDVDPLGMPTRRFKPGNDYFIELSLLNKELFGDITGAGQGKEIELIGKILEGRPESLGKVVEGLSAVKREENKYFAARAIRICRLMDGAHPGLFSGKLEPREIVAPWLKKMGRLAVVNTKGLRPSLRKGIVYCTIKTLYESYKREFAGGTMKVAIVVGEKELYGKGKSHLDREANALIKSAGDYGIGIFIDAESELDIDPEIMQNATLRLQQMEANGASVMEQSKKPYRIRLRPTLSAM